MTAEVAIINRQAIALAADSAVTVNVFGETKIYNSANKLFALSSHCPVGIMIYGSAQLTGVPWETLIKVYRKNLKSRSFARLIDYCNDFLDFLSKNLSFFREEDQIESIRSSAYINFLKIKKSISEQIENTIIESGKISKTETNNIVNEVIDEFHREFEDFNFLPNFSIADVKMLVSRYEQLFEQAIDAVFDELRITKKNRNKLTRIGANSLLKNNFSPNISGIVIAGFGEEEVLPNLYAYEIECVFDGKLKFRKNPEKSYINQPNSVIIPFAQEEMVFTFVGGIDPKLDQISRYLLDEVLRKYFEASLNAAQIENKSTDKLRDDLAALREALVSNFMEQTMSYRQKYHIDPILNMVSILPKDELAAMAEALVNLTSLKRRVSTDAETVGGPTDVALISKGDGFVWVRRKHYFNAEINPDFFANRFGSVLTSNKGGGNNGS